MIIINYISSLMYLHLSTAVSHISDSQTQKSWTLYYMKSTAAKQEEKS